MAVNIPLCCAPHAFRLLSRQVSAIETPDALLQGAIAISMHQVEAVDPDAIDTRLQSYADTVRQRVHGRQPQALLAHLHELLFEEEGFRGDIENYYSTTNSYLPLVLETKRGLPIILSLIYQNVAVRLGIRCWGVALPGHFLNAVESEGRTILIDPFAGGRMLTLNEASERLREIFGPETECTSDMIQPAGNRPWLTRILQNLLNIFGSEGHYADVAAMLEMEMVLWPDEDRLQRDLGLVLARCGLSRPAGIWLNRYLQSNPDDPQKADLKQLLQALGA